MSRSVRVTVLAENTARGRGLLAEHGLAFWIETGSRRVLFDTGQGLVISHNAPQLGAPLELADAIVLSHGHYDHTGGLDGALQAAWRTRVYAHPVVFQPKYARFDDGTSREIGLPFLDERIVRDRADELIWTEQTTETRDGLFVTGEIPRTTEFEATGGPFFIDKECQRPDPLMDDQAMFFESSQGTVVLLGCAHSGVINTLRYIRQLTDDKPIHAVIGGMHLLKASQDRIDRTVDALRELGVECLSPAHCTGMAATTELWAAFPERCFPCSVGTVMEFKLPV